MKGWLKMKYTKLDKELQKLSFQYREYFYWKFPHTRRGTAKERTQDEMLAYISRKIIDPFRAWERTEEYNRLVMLMMEEEVANDMLEIYEKVREEAKTGEDKAVKLYLSLVKEIKALNKEMQKQAKQVKKEEIEEMEEDDGLVL